MTIATWLEDAHREADNRALPDLIPILDTLAEAIATLRAADWNEDAAGTPGRVALFPVWVAPSDAR